MNYGYNSAFNSYNRPLPAPYGPTGCQPDNRGIYPPPPTKEDVRKIEKRKLWKRSTGLGFFILGYFVTMQVLAILIMMIFQFGGKSYDGGTGEYLLDIAVSVGAVLFPAAVFLAASNYRLRDGFSKTHVKPELLVPLVLMGMGVAMAANFAATVFDENIALFGLQNQISMTEDSTLNTLEIILYSVAVSIVPAFAEELGFRGIFMGSLRKFGDSFAIVASAVVFGMMHGNTTQAVFAFIVGLAFAYIDVIADSIVPSIILHFLNNFYAVVFDMLETNGALSEQNVDLISAVIVIIFCLAGIVSFIYLVKTREKIFSLSDKDAPEDTPAAILTTRDKYGAFFLNPGIIIALCTFLAEIIFNLIPTGLYS